MRNLPEIIAELLLVTALYVPAGSLATAEFGAMTALDSFGGPSSGSVLPSVPAKGPDLVASVVCLQMQP